MSEHRPDSEEIGRAAADKAASPSRRRALKAALAAAPIIMSIKSRPAFAVSDGTPGNTVNANNGVDVAQESSALSNNLSSRPGQATGLTK